MMCKMGDVFIGRCRSTEGWQGFVEGVSREGFLEELIFALSFER